MKKWVLFFLFCTPLYSQIKIEQPIQSIQIQIPHNPDLISNIQVIPLEDFSRYVLSFDDLSLNSLTYYLRIEHQTAQWEKSSINEILYLKGFNNQPIRDFIQSEGTKVPYLHYQTPLPEVKIGGNYLIQVFSDRSGKNLIFSKKIQVIDKKVNPFANIEFSNFPNLRNSHQKIELGITYPGDLFFQSKDDFIFKVYQNGQLLELRNWPSPTINAWDKKLYFQFFNSENSIPGGNEFRQIDLRSSNQKLSNVAKIEESNEINLLSTSINYRENQGIYIQKFDKNHFFVRDNYEFPSDERFIDYVVCRFYLKDDFGLPEKIYVVGGWNNFERTNTNLMEYDANSGIYFKDILLKQGIYFYQFQGENDKGIIEGNYSQTENQYEILVYLKEPGTNYENLVGYSILNFPN